MDLVYDYLENKLKLVKEDKIVVGVSTGSDSMCLLYILMELRKKIGFSIIVAHINHNKREESKEEEKFIENYSKEHDLIFEKYKIEHYEKTNFQKYAREIRYKFYEDLINKYNATYLMTAHHGDDLIETIMMRLVRGSTLKGYKGISLETKKSNYMIVRPLLFVTKEDINLFDKVNNIPYYVDKTNFSSKYTRNRYRENIIPFLHEEASNVHLKFLKYSLLMEECDNFVENVLDKAYKNIYKDNKLDIRKFEKEDIFIKKLLLERIINDLYTDVSVITSKHIELLLELIKKSKSGSLMNLPLGVEAIVDYDYLLFKVTKNENEDYCYELKDNLVIPNGMKFVKLETLENGNDTLHLSSKDVCLPLYVRNKKAGDFIELKGTLGRKKVSDIFIDKKISSYKRHSYPVVVDSNGKIIWIPKLKKSKYDSQNREMCDIIFKCL